MSKRSRLQDTNSDPSSQPNKRVKKDKKEKKEKKERKEKKEKKPKLNGDDEDSRKVQQPSKEDDQDDENNRQRSRYVPSAELTALPQSEIDSFLTSNEIEISDPLLPDNAPPSARPITSFSFLPPTEDNRYEPLKTFTTPTPIQAVTWPLLFSGRDVIGIAETGSGKTLAFGLPCIQRVVESKSSKKTSKPKALIITPTRELATQIYDQLLKCTTSAGVGVTCIYGGVSKDEQRRALKKASIVVSTPGRLKDLQSEDAVDLSKVKYLVLDEADRMLDKGFEEDIKDIVSSMPASRKRQTVMFTATWPTAVRELASTFTTSALTITIGGDRSTGLRANTSITQVVEVLDHYGKEPRLLSLLNEHQSGKKKNDRILVFCLYKKEAMRIERFIRSRGFKVAGIHGDLSQADRFKSLEAFKSGNVTLLVATDVAARGLDIPAVKVVLNVTFPLTVEDYVHRIGR